MLLASRSNPKQLHFWGAFEHRPQLPQTGAARLKGKSPAKGVSPRNDAPTATGAPGPAAEAEKGRCPPGMPRVLLRDGRWHCSGSLLGTALRQEAAVAVPGC